VLAYEWRLALGISARNGPAVPELADARQVRLGVLAHLESALTAIGLLDPQAPKKLMPRLNQLFGRAGVLAGRDPHPAAASPKPP